MMQDQFKGVIGADTMGKSCKPEAAAFDAALHRTSSHPRYTAMVEDSVKNLRTAKSLGMTTVLVAGATTHEEAATQSDLDACVDAVVSQLTHKDFQNKVPQLWRHGQVQI